MRAVRFLIPLLVACGSSPARPTAAPSTTTASNAELSPALAPLAWWLGDWQVERGATGTEHWVASSGVIFGIALQDDAFEVMIVDDGDGPGKADGTLRFFAMPGGLKSVEFAQRELRPAAATFANDAHDYPKSITYARDGEKLIATLGGGDQPDAFTFTRTTAARAPALEAADRAFAADTAARGIDGWVAAFDPEGAMIAGTRRVEGADAIRALMSDLLATTKVAWAPIASAARGNIGFTVGKATFTGANDSWRSTYVTIWKRQPDGAWKVLFDTGRTVQAD